MGPQGEAPGGCPYPVTANGAYGGGR